MPDSPGAVRRMHHGSRRRLLSIALALALCGLVSGCEKAAKAPRIGFLAVGSREGRAFLIEGFLRGLREHGYVEGQNIVIEYRFAEGRNDRLPELAAELVDQKVKLILASGSPLKYRLPTITDFRELPEAGGLLSFGPDLVDSYRRAATHVAKILHGANPADLPMEQPTKFDLFVNLETARALGLTIPQSILAQATKVIQ